MSELLKLISSIPNVVWSGMIASLLTLGGVLISNRSNANRLRIQLEHDANEKTKERTLTLRKEVYLSMVEELSRANSGLSSLPQKDPSKGNAADLFQGFFSSASKLQIVAETKTAMMVNELSALYGSMVLRLMENASPLQLVRSQIATFDNLYTEAQSQVNRVLSELAKFSEQANTDKIVFDALNRSFEIFQNRTKEYAQKRSEAWDEYNRMNADFQKRILIEMRDIGSSQIPALVEIRRDLGLESDLDAYKTQLEDLWDKTHSQIVDLIDKEDEG